MDMPPIKEIISSIGEKKLLDLRDLADLLKDRFAVTAVIGKSAEEKARAAEAYWTPRYSLILVSINCPPGKKTEAIKLIRILSYCSLLEGKEMVDNPDSLPRVIWSRRHMHPNECRDELREYREALEALGAVFKEEYNLGYYD